MSTHREQRSDMERNASFTLLGVMLVMRTRYLHAAVQICGFYFVPKGLDVIPSEEVKGCQIRKHRFTHRFTHLLQSSIDPPFKERKV